MARLGNGAYETQRLSTGGGTAGEPGLTVSSLTACTIDTSFPRSGKGCLKCAAGVTSGYGQLSVTAVKDRTFYYKFGFRLSAFPAATNAIARLFDATGTVLEMSSTVSGHIEMWNAVTASHPVEGAAFVGTEEWNVVEIMLRIPTEGKGLLSWRLNGVTIAAEQEMSVRNTGITGWRVGNIQPSAVMNVYVDDMAYNDDQGASENTWIGHLGKIVMLWPDSQKARLNYTDGAGGTTELHKALKPPGNGVETPTLAEQQIKTTSTEGNVELFMKAYEDLVSNGGGGMKPADVIKWVFPILRGGQSTATARGLGWTFVSNPVVGEITGGLNAEIAKAEPTGWRTVTWSAYTYYPPTIQKQVKPVIKIRKSVSTTDNVFADLAGILVEYTPVEAATLPTSKRQVYIGAVMDGDVGLLEGTGERGDAPYVEATQNLFEEHAGRSMGLIGYSDPTTPLKWDGFGTGATSKVGTHGSIPVKTVGGSLTFLNEVAERKQDSAIEAWAEGARAYGKPVFLRLWWEANGTWWAFARAENYVKAYRRFYEVVNRVTSNVSFIYCVNVIYDTASEEYIDKLYPGHKYVDWWGVDGYSGQNIYKKEGTKKPLEVFQATYKKMLSIAAKPILICETATSETGTDKKTWIRELLGPALEAMPKIKGVMWYNEYAEHTSEAGTGRVDWPIESSWQAREYFRESAKPEFFIGGGESYGAEKPPVPESESEQKEKTEGSFKNILVRNSYPPDDLGFTITTPGGRIVRWGGDEPRPENVLGNVSISTEIPGGFKELTGVLNRDPQQIWPELQPYSDVEAYLPSGKRVFEGYLDKAPDVSGEEASISPAALGYQSMMEDNKGIQVGFINMENSGWGDPSALRLKALLEANYLPSQVTVNVGFQDTGPSFGAGVFFTYDQQKQAGKHPLGESWWYGGGVDIGQILTNAVAPKAGGLGSEQHNIAWLTKDDNGGSGIAGADAFSGVQTQNIVSALEAGYKYALIQSRYDGEGFTGEFGGDTYGRTHIVILGYPALTLRGSWPDVGLKAQDMLVSLFERFGGGLTAKASNVEDDGFVIPQAWYSDPSSLADIVKDLIKYGWYDWFFYRGKEFEYRKPFSYGRVWKTTVAGSNLNEVGIDSSRTWDSVIVQWTDVDGSVRTAGPRGSGCRIESEHLEITSQNNLAVAAGRTRRGLLQINGAITESTAIELGIRFLEESELVDRSGSMTLSGYVMDEKGYYHPVSEVRAGDWIEPVDAHDHSPRKIVHTNYNHAQKQNELDLDAPASGMDAVLERLSAAVVPLGIS